MKNILEIHIKIMVASPQKKKKTKMKRKILKVIKVIQIMKLIIKMESNFPVVGRLRDVPRVL